MFSKYRFLSNHFISSSFRIAGRFLLISKYQIRTEVFQQFLFGLDRNKKLSSQNQLSFNRCSLSALASRQACTRSDKSDFCFCPTTRLENTNITMMSCNGEREATTSKPRFLLSYPLLAFSTFVNNHNKFKKKKIFQLF